MLIIKRGKNSHDYKKFICYHCGTEFIADKDEYVYSFRSNRESGNYVCNCPVCKDFVWTTKDIPDYEYDELRSQYEQKG